MSEFSLIVVLRIKKTRNIVTDMAKVAIKSEKITPFERFFSIMEQFVSKPSSVIDSTLGLRCRLFGYQYSKIIHSPMYVCFCGESCIEDVTTHLKSHLAMKIKKTNLQNTHHACWVKLYTVPYRSKKEDSC